MNQIRDPYASMLPSSLRHHNELLRQQQLREKNLQCQVKKNSNLVEGSNMIGIAIMTFRHFGTTIEFFLLRIL